MAKTATLQLKLDTETWGDLIHRAYRTARARSGRRRDPVTREATFSYRTVAAKLEAAGIATSDQALMRLEELDEMPAKTRMRQVAYFALIAYGYDPADFGLTSDTVNLVGFDINKIKRLVAPTFSWTPRLNRTPVGGKGPGQRAFSSAA